MQNNKIPIGRVEFTDMSNGLPLSENRKKDYVETVIQALKDGKTHYSVLSGNFLVVGVAYDTQYEIFITENYASTSVYKRDAEIPIDKLTVW